MKNKIVLKIVTKTNTIAAVLLGLFFAFGILAQEPAAGPEKPINFPAVKESKLKNGMKLAVIEKRSLPLVTVQLLIPNGASAESIDSAGSAALTSVLLTKGTTTRTAQQISEQIEFLGGSISANAGWNSTVVTMSVTSDKLDQAMAIFADVVRNPVFNDAEVDLAKSQALDGLKYNLTQPGFLASYVATVQAFGEHPPTGTVESI